MSFAKTIGPAINWGKKLTKNKWSKNFSGLMLLSWTSTKKAICWNVKNDIASGINKLFSIP